MGNIIFKNEFSLSATAPQPFLRGCVYYQSLLVSVLLLFPPSFPQALLRLVADKIDTGNRARLCPVDPYKCPVKSRFDPSTLVP